MCNNYALGVRVGTFRVETTYFRLAIDSIFKSRSK